MMKDSINTLLTFVCDCGYGDLCMIEDMDSDFLYKCLDEIRQTNGNFSLQNILSVAVDLVKTHLIYTIKERIEEAKSEDDEELASALEKLNPEEDFDYFINYLDTHIYLSNYNDYENLIPDELEYLENQIGLEYNV